MPQDDKKQGQQPGQGANREGQQGHEGGDTRQAGSENREGSQPSGDRSSM